MSVCTGIFGLDAGVHAAYGPSARTVVALEGEAFCVALLATRMSQGLIADCPIWSDVKTFDGLPWRGAVDCIIGGYPCQPFSVSGKRKGEEDPRHLWPYIAKHIRTIQPAFCFFENVPGHLTLGFEQVCEDLSRMGYAIEAGIFSAEECGALHRRERLFFLAYSPHPGRQASVSDRIRTQQAEKQRPASRGDSATRKMANANHNERRQQCSGGQPVDWHDDSLRPQWPQDLCQPAVSGEEVADADCGCGKIAQPAVDGLTDGHAQLVDHIARGWPADWEDGVPRTTQAQPHRTDQLRALGNAVVPVVAAKAWTTLWAQMEASLAAALPEG